jgi:hypothetical protein
LAEEDTDDSRSRSASQQHSHREIPSRRNRTEFTPERLKEIKSFDPTKLDEEERAAHEGVDDFSRGISEIEIE